MKQVAKLNIIPAQSLGFFFLNSNDTNFLIPLFSLISKELRCFKVDIKLTNAARLSSWAPVSFRSIFWCVTILRVLVWSLRKKKKSKPQKMSDKRKRPKVLFLSFKHKFCVQVISYSLHSDSFEMSFFEFLDWCFCETQQVTKFAILCYVSGQCSVFLRQIWKQFLPRTQKNTLFRVI